MLIRNVSREEVLFAVATASEQFDGNIRIKRLDHAGSTREHKSKYRVTLTVASSQAAGSRISPPNPWRAQRHISAACWHAHKAFLNALPPAAVVTGGRETTIKWSPGMPHQDWNIGSQAYPCQASEACECAY